MPCEILQSPLAQESFRDRILAGGSQTEMLFGEMERETCRQFLSQRYPHPQLVALADRPIEVVNTHQAKTLQADDEPLVTPIPKLRRGSSAAKLRWTPSFSANESEPTLTPAPRLKKNLTGAGR